VDMVRTEAPADWRKPPETANPLHLQLLHQGSTLLIVIIRESGTLKIKVTQSGPGITFCYNSKAHSIGDHLWLLCVTWNLRRVRKSTLSEPILESRKPALGPGWIVVDHHTGHLLPISRQTRRG